MYKTTEDNRKEIVTLQKELETKEKKQKKQKK